MLIRDLLSDDDLNKFRSFNKSKAPKNEQQVKSIKSQEKLSTREWKDIMGMNRDTYTRRNGAVRRK